ncbi:hypothetical protein [Variovorax sp. PBL-E5]|uniref:hypothetical protein n=1 Tax=Variovorax sp. PBL-E5 TaxID=434014 RepID=UPI001318FD72|nr:hypothetical protein [Variovorax sp. PBL-E5]VTU27328.1 hypothetical protein E5CHR_02376 [Variovorax sp. PBL-E5]
MEMKKTVRISADLLPASLGMRFDALFNVARTRSIVQWESVAPIGADVVVVDRAIEVRADAVALVIGDAPKQACPIQAVRLEAAYGVASLIAALDLAAVRILNLRDANNKSQPMPLGGDIALAFKLRHWVSLDSGMASPAHSRALAAMARKAVTRDWIVKNCELSATQIDALLNALQRRDALYISEAPAAALVNTTIGDRQATPGFIGKLRQWLSGARSTPVPTGPHTS